MILSTKSPGVRRLSLVLGFVAGGCYIILRHPVTNNEGPSQALKYAVYNLADILIVGTIVFFLAWAAVRIVAWIVAGFLNDGSR